MKITWVGMDCMRLVFWKDQMFQDTPGVAPNSL